jgi:hypothetical protein
MYKRSATAPHAPEETAPDPPLPPRLQSVDMVRLYEARTASAYVAAWEDWPLHWSAGEARRVPPHWQVARAQSSPLAPGDNARHAVDPLTAAINQACALLEGQCRQALTQFGFDVACSKITSQSTRSSCARSSLTDPLFQSQRQSLSAGRIRAHSATAAPLGQPPCRPASISRGRQLREASLPS